MSKPDFNYYFIEGNGNNDYVLKANRPFHLLITLYTFPKKEKGERCTAYRTLNKTTFQTFTSIHLDENGYFTGRGEYYSFSYPPEKNEQNQNKMYLTETAEYINGTAVKQNFFNQNGEIAYSASHILPLFGNIPLTKMKHLYETAKKHTNQNLENFILREIASPDFSPAKTDVLLSEEVIFKQDNYHYWYNYFTDILQGKNNLDSLLKEKGWSDKINKYRFSNSLSASYKRGTYYSHRLKAKRVAVEQNTVSNKFTNLKVD